MELADVARTWDTLGRIDPLWAVMSVPEKRYGRWDPDDFFRSGRDEVDDVLGRVEKSVGAPLGAGRALDFGCGVGRVTQALAGRYDSCDGVDIALSMIDWAERFNRVGGRVRYHLNTGDDLRLFADASFDLVYSVHALQHLERRYVERYVGEFFRLLAPGGSCVIELVTEPVRGVDGPLSDDGFALDLTAAKLARVAPGQRATVSVTVVNRGLSVLPRVGTDGWFQVCIGNHWIDAEGVRIFDDGRAGLPRDLAPGDETTVELEVTAPSEPGRYVLEIDGVQEGVAWFADKGGSPARATVTVAEGPSLADRLRQVGVRRPAPPLIDRELRTARKEMFGSTEAEVTGWIASAGGAVLDVIDWDDISGSRSYDWQRRGFVCARRP